MIRRSLASSHGRRPTRAERLRVQISRPQTSTLRKRVIASRFAIRVSSDARCREVTIALSSVAVELLDSESSCDAFLEARPRWREGFQSKR